MTILMCAAFFVCWTPYAVVSFITAFWNHIDIPLPVSTLPSLFAKSGTVYNPTIYFLMVKRYRTEVVEFLAGCCKQHSNKVDQTEICQCGPLSVPNSEKRNLIATASGSTSQSRILTKNTTFSKAETNL